MTETPEKPNGPSVKTVRRTLASGAVKDYHYERAPKEPRKTIGDLRGLFNRYCESPEFTGLAKEWQTRKLWLYRLMEEDIGWMTIADLEARTARTDFYELRDKHAHTAAPGRQDDAGARLGARLGL